MNNKRVLTSVDWGVLLSEVVFRAAQILRRRFDGPVAKIARSWASEYYYSIMIIIKYSVN